MQHRKLYLWLLLPALFTAGCYNAEEVNAFLLKPRAPISGQEYRVLPPDVLTISSRHILEITGLQQQVRPDGRINLPLVGELDVANRTPLEIEQMITRAAREYYDQADATVTVTGYNSQKYFVFGEVARPGPYAWTGHDALLDALAVAQPTFLAWPERIFIVRGDCPQEGGRTQAETTKKYSKTGVHEPDEDQPRRVMMINMMAMVRHGDLSNNILLRPNDVIYVQPNPLAALGLAIQSLLFPVRPAMEAAGVPNVMQNAGNP